MLRAEVPEHCDCDPVLAWPWTFDRRRALWCQDASTLRRSRHSADIRGHAVKGATAIVEIEIHPPSNVRSGQGWKKTRIARRGKRGCRRRGRKRAVDLAGRSGGEDIWILPLVKTNDLRDREFERGRKCAAGSAIAERLSPDCEVGPVATNSSLNPPCRERCRQRL